MKAYYNEHDKFAAQWLRNLIAAGHIAPGEVDERDIQEVTADDVKGFTQVHLFAGIGGWSYALRLAGWADTRPVWTGSAPCQPYSTAGRRKGKADARHLWPEMHRLICECKPGRVFGEQVAAAIGLNWLDAVSDDLEGAGYAVGAIVLPACGVGAPHIRQRVWFAAESVDDAAGARRERAFRGAESEARNETRLCLLSDGSKAGELAEPDSEQHERSGNAWRGRGEFADGGDADKLGDAERDRLEGRTAQDVCGAGRGEERTAPGCTSGAWSAADWLPCCDGKARPVESGTFPLANGVPARVGRLRGYGNAIVPQVAEQFIRAYMECRP